MAAFNSITVDRVLFTRLFSKIRVSTTNFYKGVPCWEWTAFVNSTTGYAQFGIANVGLFLSHRLFYQLFVGEIPVDLQCDHLCRVRHCVNPAHIEAVTPKENMARGIRPIRLGVLLKTICKNGHHMIGRNVVPTKRGDRVQRACRQCRNIWRNAYRRQKRDRERSSAMS